MNDRARLSLSGALLLLTFVATALVVWTGHGAARSIVTFSALLLVPGGALLCRLRVVGFAEWLGLAVALSLAIDVAGALALVWTSWWRPEVLAGTFAAVSVAALVIDIRNRWEHRPWR